VVRGGQFPELRTRSTLEALTRLRHAGLIAPNTATALAEAYVFLRQVEHRIQYLDDLQTHVLPTQDADLAWVACTLGLDSAAHLLEQLNGHREQVAQEFDKLLGGTAQASCNNCPTDASPPAPLDWEELVALLPSEFRARVQGWSAHPRVLALREDARQRLVRLIERTNLWLHQGVVTETAAVRLADWIETLLRRENYLALLLERAPVHQRLLRLLGAARWPARYLVQHPGVIDELASDTMLHQRFMAADFEAELENRRAALARTGEDDDEALLNLLRRAHHAEVFRTLARDLEGQLDVEQIADDLSALADAVLRCTTRWCWERLKSKHRETAQFAIIAYGKLGGKELGYGSDLDLVFVYDDKHERASEVYTQLVRKLVNWLTIKTAEGDLYEIDTALRPNGNSGLLVTTFDAYANYQQQRGSNTAWTWEHQAMTRARFCLGEAALGQRFEAVRQAVMTAPRTLATLQQEIKTMREKVRSAHPVKAQRFDVKHSPGGMLDVEFAVQYLLLAHACTQPDLLDNVGNIALLERCEKAALLPPGIGHNAAVAYRALRQAQHQARLNEEPTQVPLSDLQTPRAAVLALWQAVFERAAY
jgi:glutamate-ammonia-ligase adenylyltransferase